MADDVEQAKERLRNGLVALRKSRRLTQAGLGTALGGKQICDRNAIYRVESGKPSTLPGRDFWIAADHALDADGTLLEQYDLVLELIKENDQNTIAAIMPTTPMPVTEQPSTSDPSTVLGAPTGSSDAVRGSTAVAIRKAGDYLGAVDTDSTGVGGAAFAASLTVCAPIPSRIGWNEVEQVRAATSALAASENLFGGGLTCEAAAGQLRWAARLLDVGTQDATRRALTEAVGNLAAVVAFSAFDIGDQPTAARCFRFALRCADEAGSWSLRAATLADMARQSVYLGDLDEALSLIEFAQVRADRLTATGRAMVWTVRARLMSILGRHREAADDVARADEHFAQQDPAVDPPWLTYYDDAEHQGSTARALIPQSLVDRDPGCAAQRLESAVLLHSDAYPRSKAFSRARLATLMMGAGDPRQAVLIGGQALDDASGLHSRRMIGELVALQRACEPHIGIPEVADLRHLVRTTTGVD